MENFAHEGIDVVHSVKQTASFAFHLTSFDHGVEFADEARVFLDRDA